MKKKISIHLNGIGILLKLLIYSNFHNYKFKYYLIENKYEKKKYKHKYLKKLEFEKKIIVTLKKKFNIDLDILEKVIETNIFLNNQKKKVNYSVTSKIVIENNDFVSNNLFNYLREYMQGKKISFITDGIGTLQIGKKNSFIKE